MHYEERNIQKDSGQTICDNRTPTHKLCSNQPRKPKHIFLGDQPRTGGVGSLTASGVGSLTASSLFPATPESQKLSPNQLQRMPSAPTSRPPLRAHLKPSPFLTACLCVSIKLNDYGWLPCYGKLFLFSCGHLHFFPQFSLLLTIIQQSRHIFSSGNYVHFTEEKTDTQRPNHFPWRITIK